MGDQANDVKLKAREAQLPDVAAGHWSSAAGLQMAVGYATKTRADLGMHDVPDLALANALYLASGEIAIQTAAKERMRWLSVQLVLSEARATSLEAELKRRDEVASAAWALCDDTEGTVFTDTYGEHYHVPKASWDRLATAIAALQPQEPDNAQ